MISSLQIEGFRGFQHFEMTRLGRVNLLVGTNNCGKTSVLEALYLLTAAADPAALGVLLRRRGEFFGFPKTGVDADISRLFHGWEGDCPTSFQVTAQAGGATRQIRLVLEKRQHPHPEGSSHFEGHWGLQITGNPPPPAPRIPLSIAGGIPVDVLEQAVLQRSEKFAPPAIFVDTDSLRLVELAALWDRVALQPEEEVILRALQCLDPSVERIAALSGLDADFVARSARGGFIVKLRGNAHPVLLGSMGDGMWRMLALAIAITQCKDGMLLVDEIDTGLHYSVMAGMWKLIFGAAKELNVQVFASTHSQDCVRSLAEIAAEADAANPVTIQRIERDRPRSVPYSEEEITVAAEKAIEVR